MVNTFFEAWIYGSSLPDTYHQALCTLQNAPIIPCPDWNTNQKECSMTMVVTQPITEPMISKCSFCDPFSLEQYRQEMLDGILDFEIYKGNWVYTYHDRMVKYSVDNQIRFPETPYLNQIDFIIDELKRNPYSRRAVIDIRDNSEDMYSYDPACLQHIQFFIRDKKLHMKVLFRSNDACKAAFMNAFALIKLQEKIATELNIQVGTYTHRANSFHCYERDFSLLESYINRIQNATCASDVCYYYTGDWENLMEDEKPNIAKKVASLKLL